MWEVLASLFLQDPSVRVFGGFPVLGDPLDPCSFDLPLTAQGEEPFTSLFALSRCKEVWMTDVALRSDTDDGRADRKQDIGCHGARKGFRYELVVAVLVVVVLSPVVSIELSVVLDSGTDGIIR